MRTPYYSLLLLLMVPAGLWAQGSVPMPASGEMPRMATGSEFTPTNVIVGRVAVSAGYDDNLANSSVHPQGGAQFYVTPSISFQQTRKRLFWTLTYSGGLGITQRVANRNQLTQGLDGEFTYRATPRLTVHFRQDWSVTTDPFARFGNNLFLPELGPLNQPNDTVSLPFARRSEKESSVNVSYVLSPHNVMGVSGNYFDRHYDNVVTATAGSQLIQTRGGSGSFFFSHQFTPRESAGFDYDFLDLSFGQGARTVTHSFLLTDQLSLTSRTKLVFFVGPEYALTHDQVAVNFLFFIVHLNVNTQSWSTKGGAIYSWTGERTAAQVSLTRQVSDGGGLFGAVRLTSASVSVRRRLTNRWTANVGAQYADDRALNLSGSALGFHVASGNVGLIRQMGPNLALGFSYARQQQTGSALGETFGNHNCFQVSLDYRFMRPLGR
jgi:hypothetical protein